MLLVIGLTLFTGQFLLLFFAFTVPRVPLQRVRQHLGWGEFDGPAERDLRTRLQERAAEGMTPGPLLALAEDLLRGTRIVLPAASTLERLVASVATHAVQDLFDRIRVVGAPARCDRGHGGRAGWRAPLPACLFQGTPAGGTRSGDRCSTSPKSAGDTTPRP